MLKIECTKQRIRGGGFEIDTPRGVQFCSVLFGCLVLPTSVFFIFSCVRLHTFVSAFICLVHTVTRHSVPLLVVRFVSIYIYAVCMRLKVVQRIHSFLLVYVAAFVRSITRGSSLKFRLPFMQEGRMHIDVLLRVV